MIKHYLVLAASKINSTRFDEHNHAIAAQTALKKSPETPPCPHYIDAQAVANVRL